MLCANLAQFQAKANGNFITGFNDSTMDTVSNILKYPNIYLCLNKTVKSPVTF